MISRANTSNFVAIVVTNATLTLGLPWGAGFSVVGCYNVMNANGTLKARLIKILGAFENNVFYTGPWNRFDPVWNTTGETYAS